MLTICSSHWRAGVRFGGSIPGKWDRSEEADIVQEPVSNNDHVLQFDVSKAENFRSFITSALGDLTYEGHVLPAYSDTNWPLPDWRRYIMWELAEMDFRSEFIVLDRLITTIHPHVIGNTDATLRFSSICEAWGGGGLKPGTGENWLCSTDRMKRMSALASFYHVISVWPRTLDFLMVWDEYKTPESWHDLINDQSGVLEKLEAEVWLAYTQTYVDYRHKMPPLPFVKPKLPF